MSIQAILDKKMEEPRHSNRSYLTSIGTSALSPFIHW